MGNRILKESVCYNERIAGLCWFEEVVFYRLMVSCDDFGRIDGRERFLLGRLFPLRPDLTATELRLAIDGLVRAGLVCRYLAAGHEYLVLCGWDEHQKPRRQRAVWPAPSDGATGDCSMPEGSCGFGWYAGMVENGYAVEMWNTDEPAIEVGAMRNFEGALKGVAPYDTDPDGAAPELDPEKEMEPEQDSMPSRALLTVVPGRKGKGTGEVPRPPSLEEVSLYIDLRGLRVDPSRFWSYYAAKNWQVGRRPMHSWKSALNIWDYNVKMGWQADGTPVNKEKECGGSAASRNNPFGNEGQ